MRQAMLFYIVPLFLAMLAVAGIFKVIYKNEYSWKEFAIVGCAMLCIAAGGVAIARHASMTDTELWNGRVTAKNHDSMSCCHCRTECDTCTRTTSDGRTETYSCNCREVCNHTRDYYWSIDVSTGDTITIDRCEPSPHRVPQAWTDAKVGDPASVEHRYQNYLLADPESVLFQSATPSATLSDERAPRYPRVFAFHKADRFINHGTQARVPDWDARLDALNADLGAGKQVNVIVIATTGTDPRYAETVQRDWLYGKKNDLIFVLGASDGETIQWARVVSISKVEMLKVRVQDELPGKKMTDPEGFFTYLNKLIMEDFERTPMADFEYLASAAKPSSTGVIILSVIGLLSAAGLSFVMVKKDVFGEESYRWNRRRNRW